MVLGLYRGYIGIMEKKMEATIVYWGNIGIMENKMEATILGLYWVVVKVMVPFWVPRILGAVV